MDSEASMDSDASADSKISMYSDIMDPKDAVDSNVSMGLLADKITVQVKIWEEYHIKHGIPLLTFDQPEKCVDIPVLLPQMPRHVLDAREQIIDTASQLLELAAGPSRMISMALSQVQFISALNWLLRFKIFELIQAYKAIDINAVALEANVPVSELTRMLRIATANHIFWQDDEGDIWANDFSKMLSKDEDFLKGLPFFCDTVMPASGKMVERTVERWASQEKNETARNIALKDDLNFAQYLTREHKANEYARLMSLMGYGHSLYTAYAAEVVSSINWSSLGEGALVVHLGSCSPWLAELFPHLQFHVHSPQDKIGVMQGFMRMNYSDVLDRISFFVEGGEIAKSAKVYLLVGLIHDRPDKEIQETLRRIWDIMGWGSRIIIVDSLLPDPGEETLAMERVARCRDITMRQLNNSGSMTLGELKEIANQLSEYGLRDKLAFESHTRRSDGTATTVVFRKC